MLDATQDAIHLAAVQLVAPMLGAVVTYDRRMADAAARLGFPVAAPSWGRIAPAPPSTPPGRDEGWGLVERPRWTVRSGFHYRFRLKRSSASR